MSRFRHVVLIHGAWSRALQLADMRDAFEARGYSAHVPTLRHHELPQEDGAPKVAEVRLQDYVDDLLGVVGALDSPPLLVGHSMGGLLAQIVATRTRHTGLVVACPAPAAGIFGTTPINLRIGPSSFRATTPIGQADAAGVPSAIPSVGGQHAHRGRSARYPPRPGLRIRSRELGIHLGSLRLSTATAVDFAAITTPVLVLGGERDRIVSSGVIYRTAARYGRASAVLVSRSDHMVFSGAALPVTMGHIDGWMANNGIE